MTCDVWKEKECVVVDFDPAIMIKIISIRICHCMYYVDSNRVCAYFINGAKSLCTS